MSAPSPQDLYDAGKAAAQVVRTALKFSPGDVTDAQCWGGTAQAIAVLAYGAAKFRAVFLDGAEGADLTALCHDRGVDRDPGDYGIGTVTFSRVAATAGAGTIPAGTRFATDPDSTGKFPIFTTNTDLVFNAFDLTKSVAAKCTQIGKLGNIAAGTVTRCLDLPTLWDQTLTVTNGAAFVGGNPAESDPDLRDRTRNFWLTQARGTIDALIYAATQLTPGCARASCVVDNSGIVTMYVADANGNSNQALADAVKKTIEGPPMWRDAADVVYVVGALLYTVTITLTLTVKLGTDVNTLLDAVRNAVVAAVNRLNPGETLYRDMVSSAAKSVAPSAIKSVAVLLDGSPVDLVPATNTVIGTDIAHVNY